MPSIGVRALVASVLLAGCGSAATGSTCPATDPPTYDNFGREFFANYCDRCHVSLESPRLASLADIQGRSVLIDLQAAAGPDATNTAMPQSGTAPTLAERQRLGEWLACGAR